MYYPKRPLDPNEIPPSPSPSAVHRLSIYESAPSALPTESGSEATSDSPKLPAPSISVPPVDTIPDIPDSLSKVSDVPPPPPEKDFPSRRQPAKRSKLATLASSRVSTISSSRSSALETTSVLTYPALRPSPESRLSYASRGTTVETPPSETSEKSEGTVRGIPAPQRNQCLQLEHHPLLRRRCLLMCGGQSTRPWSWSNKMVARKLPVPWRRVYLKPLYQPPGLLRLRLRFLVELLKRPWCAMSLACKARPQSKLAKLAQAKANGAVP
ncbi:hypothetical protein EDD17DRAFT_1802780 [Pisolithus thermaeus]|nr:hypothetical protein EDD17DRAFT_1802780 [Pisolithus thermaeus]